MGIFEVPVHRSRPAKKSVHSDRQEAVEEDNDDSSEDERPWKAEDEPLSQEGDCSASAGVDDEQEITSSYKPLQVGVRQSLRHQHQDVLITILHKSILDADWPRAERTYGLLLRSKGVDIRLCYDLGLQILNHADSTGRRSMEFMERLIVAYPPLKERKGKRNYDRADVFVRILIDLRMKHEQYKVAHQELENWLLIPPYKDDLALWQALVKVCTILEEQASRFDDKLEMHRFTQRRLKAEARIRSAEESAEDELVKDD